MIQMKEHLLKKTSVAICMSSNFYLHGKSYQNANTFFSELNLATHVWNTSHLNKPMKNKIRNHHVLLRDRDWLALCMMLLSAYV